MRNVGTISRGIRCPIIRENDNLVEIVSKSVIDASKSDNFSFNDKDVIAITESIVARAQGNYASIDDIAEDIRKKFNDETIGLVFPITSRNRFSICLKGIARGARKIVLMLSYPRDEVGNALIDEGKIYETKINPYSDLLNEEDYRKYFGYQKHEFTGVDYVEYYKELIKSENCEVEIIFGNQAKMILPYTKNIIACDIHTRNKTKQILKDNGAIKVYGLDDILKNSVNGSGYNSKYGLLGSNKADENRIKLFPNDCQKLVDDIQTEMFEKTGKHFEVMVYGDGAFKDPVGKIWELADPVVSPAYTNGLKGTPNEIKIKYLADSTFSNLNGEELNDAIKKSIKDKDKNLKGQMVSEGTTPRQLTDLIGSLSDLTSGSGDKGTPIVLIQGYFDNYTNL